MEPRTDFTPPVEGDATRDDLYRLGALGGGAALLTYGLVRRGLMGWGAAAAGGYVAWRAWTDARQAEPVDVVRTLTVEADRERLYSLWMDAERAPEWMRFVETARRVDEDHVEWGFRPPGFPLSTLHLRIVEARAPERIVWQTEGRGLLGHSGRVDFRDAPGDRGTEVRLALRFAANDPASRVALRFLDRLPTLGVLEDLRNFKSLAETGEIPRTTGQPRGAEGRLGQLRTRGMEGAR